MQVKTCYYKQIYRNLTKEYLNSINDCYRLFLNCSEFVAIKRQQKFCQRKTQLDLNPKRLFIFKTNLILNHGVIKNEMPDFVMHEVWQLITLYS